jgi:hypothetical protein
MIRVSLTMLAIGVGFILLSKPIASVTRTGVVQVLASAIFFTLIAGLLSLFITSAILPNSSHYKDILAQQEYRVVEGEIQAFKPDARGGTGSFAVGGVTFIYGYQRPGLTGRDLLRASISEGMAARVTYIDESNQVYKNVILRLEVER